MLAKFVTLRNYRDPLYPIILNIYIYIYIYICTCTYAYNRKWHLPGSSRVLLGSGARACYRPASRRGRDKRGFHRRVTKVFTEGLHFASSAASRRGRDKRGRDKRGFHGRVIFRFKCARVAAFCNVLPSGSCQAMSRDRAKVPPLDGRATRKQTDAPTSNRLSGCPTCFLAFRR